MRLQATYRGPEAQRFALEPAPYGAGWAEVADEAEVIFVYEKEPHEPGDHFYFLLACDAEGNEERRKRVEGWGSDRLREENLTFGTTLVVGTPQKPSKFCHKRYQSSRTDKRLRL